MLLELVLEDEQKLCCFKKLFRGCRNGSVGEVITTQVWGSKFGFSSAHVKSKAWRYASIILVAGQENPADT